MQKTVIRVRYSRHLGPIGLRGSPPLSWTASLPPGRLEGNVSVFEVDAPDGVLLEFKPVRGEERFASGRNFTVLSGETAYVEPYFEKAAGVLHPEMHSMFSKELGRDVKARVFLPPSYGELDERRYPVLYAQDGQSLFGEGSSWRLDETLNELYALGAVEEVIVVAVHTDEGRLAMLSPCPDPEHGGGDGPKYLSFLAETAKPYVDTFARTKRGRDDTAIMGSSMGGLFAFFAAWTRPDVFGKAACLSSSFWWGGRFMVREVEKNACPLPRPRLYVDSGAAKSAMEEDANLRDGYHHTMALRKALVSHCYTAGENLVVMAFPGQAHDNASWAARLGVPLQLLFPPKC